MDLPHTKQTGFLRLKFETKADQGLVEGYGSVFGNLDEGGDIVAAGAFAASLAKHKAAGTTPVMLWMHKPDAPVGRWLSMTEDGVGLHVKGRFNLETTAGKDAFAHVMAGDVSGLSIGYRIAKGGSEYRDGINIIKTAELVEVSVVTVPMNPKARILLASKGDLEQLLTKSGLSKEAAKRVAFGGWSALSSKDDDDQVAELVRAVKASAQRYERL